MEESYVDKSRVTLREISKDAAKSIIVKQKYKALKKEVKCL